MGVASQLCTMEVFLGTWKFEKCEHFEEYLKALGISAPLRKLAMLTSPTLTIRQSGDKYSITTDATVRSVTVEYTLGETVEETTVDLRTVSSVLTFEAEKCCLILTSTDKHGVSTAVKRTVSGDLMMVEMEVKGVTATAVFKRKLI